MKCNKCASERFFTKRNKHGDFVGYECANRLCKNVQPLEKKGVFDKKESKGDK